MADKATKPPVKKLGTNSKAKQVMPKSPVEEAAHIGSLYRTAGINLSLPNVAVLLRLNKLYQDKGLDATINDVQMVINSILSNPEFQPAPKQ